jgi:hypothetical protein
MSFKNTSYWMIFGFLLSGLTSLGQNGKGFSFRDIPGKYLDILLDGRIAGRYMYEYDNSDEKKLAETYKPYLHLFDNQGLVQITKGPDGGFTHHRGIFIGWNKILWNGKTYDRWHMKGGDQIHRKFKLQKADNNHATFTSVVDWTDENGKPFITEERKQTFLRAPGPAYEIIDFESRIKAVAGDIVLDGDVEHAGIHFVPPNEIDKAKTLYIFPGQNVNPRKDDNLPWIAETFVLNGKPYSVVQMNHPGNPGDSKVSAYRNYARFGYFAKKPIKAGEDFTFRYRFLIAEGKMLPADIIQKCCNKFTGHKDPTPLLTIVPAEQPVVKTNVLKEGDKDGKKNKQEIIK